MQEKGVKKIVLTGGHAATTALALIEELIRRMGRDNLELSWLGAKYAREGRREPPLEEKIFPQLGIKNITIPTGRIQRHFTFWTIPSLARIPVGFFYAFTSLLRIKPKVIVSFGGFTAFPVVVVGRLLNIPIIIHEQTATAGRANRYSSRLATRIAISREESFRYFPKNKTVLTGLPIMTQIGEIKPKSKIGVPPTILVTGGSRGSKTINDVVTKLLPTLFLKYNVIHLTGDFDFYKFQNLKNDRYQAMATCAPMLIDNLYRQADLVLARAGANTVAEIIATKTPSILVPIPWSYLDEQMANAKIAQKLGIAKIIPQDQFTESTLLSAIDERINNWSDIISHTQDLLVSDAKASSNLADLVEQYIK